MAVWLSVAPTEVRWEAPVGCPGQDEVEAQVEALLLEPVEGPLEYRGRIETTTDGYRLDLAVRGAERAVEAAECSRLGTAAALIIAVEHDPIAVASAVETVAKPAPTPAADPEPPPEPEAEPEAEPEPEPEPEPEGVPGPPPPQPESPPLSLVGTLRLGAGVELGILPRVGGLFSLAGGLGGEHWRAEVGATVSLPRDVPIPGQRDFGARSLVFAGHARGCWVPGGDRLQAPLCAGLEAGGVWARGYGPGVTPQARTQAWFGALGSAGLNVWISKRFGAMVDAELDVALRQPAVRLDGIDDVFRAGAVGARFVAGPILRFP